MPPRRRAAATASKVNYVESDSDGGAGADDSSDQASVVESPDASDDEEEVPTSDEEEDEDDEHTKPKRSRGKAPSKPPPKKKRKTAAKDEDDNEDDADAEPGDITSVTKLAPAPKEHHQQGKLGKPVIDFMTHLSNPKYNDREWFQAHEKVWKWVKQDFEDFTGDFLEALMEEVDETVPYLPVKDMVYRIYRDVRFSNDKTPYKRTLMSTYSRGGRKGPFAGYHLCIRAGGESALHAGLWDPPTEHLAALRTHILNGSAEIERLKEIIHRKEFIKCFGPPKPDPAKGVVGSLWHHDPLKKAPKGVDKDHPDIHLLRLKSYCITRRFTDAEVINADPKHSGDFKKKLIHTAQIAKDFVECINDIVHP